MRKLIILAAICLATGSVLAAAQWQTLTGCKLSRNEANDGDSFHVEHNGHEYIFRLYYVDAPEVEDDFPDRVAEQAKYFNISHRRALEVGRAAARFTARQLNDHFTVITRWDDARGRSKLPRDYAFIITGEKKDLGQLLVQNGLARVFGEKAVPPDGATTKFVEQKLNALERQAKTAHLGGWSAVNSTINSDTTLANTQPRRLCSASGERHNSRCPLFNAAGNRDCSADEGRPCRLCGG
ncbi:MAG: thermonuclease family protein [Verrucomicrobiota bacterium]